MLELRGVSRREEIGRRIANAVDDILPLARKDARECLPLRHIVEQVQVARLMLTDDDMEMVREDLAQVEAQVPEDARAASIRHVCIGRCHRAMARYEAQQQQPFMMEEVHALRLGDIVFATNRFEFYLDYGLRIEARSPAQQTFVIQLTAGAYDQSPEALEFYKFLRRLEVFENSLGRNSRVILSTDSDIFRLFEDAGIEQ